MTDEAKIESLIVAMLKLGDDIDVPVTGLDDDRGIEEDRIIVERGQRTESLAGAKDSALPKAWQCSFTIWAIVATRTAEQVDALMNAVDTVMMASTPPASVATSALALFPSGNVTLTPDLSGETNPDNAEARRRSRNYIARWIQG